MYLLVITPYIFTRKIIKAQKQKSFVICLIKHCLKTIIDLK